MLDAGGFAKVDPPTGPTAGVQVKAGAAADYDGESLGECGVVMDAVAEERVIAPQDYHDAAVQNLAATMSSCAGTKDPPCGKW
jgi:hypothetical protein